MVNPSIEFRQLNYFNRNEVIESYKISVEVGDDDILEKNPEFVEESNE